MPEVQLDGYFTIDEAATRLGVSRDTIRRKIRRGELQAERRQGPYGIQWMIPESEIRTAQEITDVVPVNRPVAIPDLVNAIAARVTEAFVEEQARTRAEIKALREELAATRETQKRIERSIEERDKRLTEALRTLTERKERRPWWRRLFLRPK